MENQVRPAEKPILFSAQMVRAILEGRKTQTRRIVKRNPPFERDGLFEWYPAGEKAGFHALSDVAAFTVPSGWAADWCPYGKPGDRLWVRETFKTVWEIDTGFAGLKYAADGHCEDLESWVEQLPFIPATENWRPSIHMPRDYSRLTLEITDVRVERLQEISSADAEAEGVECNGCYVACCSVSPPIVEFRKLWNENHGPGSWDANPWVWAITFKPFPTAPSEVQA